MHLSTDSACRVLITCREGLWSEMPPELRDPIQEFNLMPFRNREIGRYREKRFPNPHSPNRERFDEILDIITRAAHPEGTRLVPQEERAPAAPLILHLAAEEAELDTDIVDYHSSPKYANSLYAITYGILHREHSRRGLCLTPSQQFLMISTLVVDFGRGPYKLTDIRTAAEYAFGNVLTDSEFDRVRNHALFKRAQNSFSFRFDYLAQFAPAVWLCDYILGGERDAVVTKFLSEIAGKSSPHCRIRLRSFKRERLEITNHETY
jgi:hypothetical protein